MAISWLGVAGGGANMMGVLAKERQVMNQYKAYAEANKYNETVLRQRADLIRSTANEREEAQRREARLKIGELNAMGAESGTGVGTGSNRALEHQNEVFAELDAMNIRYEGTLHARDAEIEADLQGWEATLNMQNRTAARKQAFWAGLGAIFGGAGAGYGGNEGGNPSGSGSVRRSGSYGSYDNTSGSLA